MHTSGWLYVFICQGEVKHVTVCYIVIDHALAIPTRPYYGIAYRQSYSTYTVTSLIKAVFEYE